VFEQDDEGLYESEAERILQDWVFLPTHHRIHSPPLFTCLSHLNLAPDSHEHIFPPQSRCTWGRENPYYGRDNTLMYPDFTSEQKLTMIYNLSGCAIKVTAKSEDRG